MRILNLYAGVGGNRKLWDGHEIVAVEDNAEIAEIYRHHVPDDEVFVGDAHEFLRKHVDEFDFIWSSPPCQTHSRMNNATRHKHLRRYVDLRLYEEILYLDRYAEGNWVVENVVPFYKPLMEPSYRVGRHLFWTNFPLFGIEDVPRPADFINLANVAGKEKLQEWLGLPYEGNVYYPGNHCPAQIYRNCVHPEIGRQILEAAL